MEKESEDRKKIVNAVESLVDENRVMNFSDAIFAFAATLLVLKIDLPVIVGGSVTDQLPSMLVNLWPQYLANIITFFIIGVYWLNHHAVFGLIRKYNKMLVWMNIVFLMSVAFLPFPVDLYGDYSSNPVVIGFFALSLAIVGYLLAAIWIYASTNHRLVDKALSKRRIKFYTMEYLVAPVIFTISIPLAIIHPAIAQLSWLLILFGVMLVNHFAKYKRLDEVEKVAAA